MTLEERLEKLERRAHLLAILSGIALAVALVAVAWPRQTADTVVAREILLHDETGANRARLAVVKGAGALFLRDERGGTRLVLAADRDTPGVTLHDEAGRVRAMLVTSSSAGLTYLGFKDDTGNDRLFLGTMQHDLPVVGIHDGSKTRIPRIALGGATDDSYGLSLVDAHGRRQFHARTRGDALDLTPRAP